LPNNPGNIEELHRRCQAIFPMNFEGSKLIVNKGLSSHFQVAHNMTIGSDPKSTGYKFGATYVGTKMLSPSEAFPLMMAEIDPSGNLNANVVHAPSERTRFKFISAIQDKKFVSTQITTDYKGDAWSGSWTLGNPDLVNGTGISVFHYLRSVTKKLALGAELAYQATPQMPGGHVAVASLASRVNIDEDSSLAATLGNSGQLHATYWQKCSEQLQMGVELEANLKMKEASTTIGYEVSLPKGNLTVRGSVDSNLVVRSLIEKKLSPLPFTLILSGLLHHTKQQYQFGCGLVIGE